MRLPTDYSDSELELYNLLVTGNVQSLTTVGLYANLEDPVDKFLVAYIFELGNTRKAAQEALGVSKATVWYKVKRIKRILKDCYKM